MFKRFFDFFDEDEDPLLREGKLLRREKRVSRRPSTHHIEAKVIYKYPKNSSVDQRDERHLIKNRQKDRLKKRHQFSNHISKRESKTRERKTKRKEKKPFQPSRVASPIYGFKERVDERVQDTPAFLRKEDLATNQENNRNVQELLVDRNFAKNQQRTKESSTFIQRKESTVENIRAAMNPFQANKQKTSDFKENSNAQVDRFRILPTKKQKESIETSSDQKSTSIKNGQNFDTLQIKTKKDKTTLIDSTLPLPLTLLETPKKENAADKGWIREQKKRLEETLSHFNVQAKVVKATQGPAVTRFEVQPNLGVKVSRVRNLSDDIKMNMAAKDIRIEAPIPGKNTIGIEVPNEQSKPVRLKEIVNTDTFKNHPSNLAIGLGVTIEGNPYITTIDEMPHGLIAGATGSGKSVCINSIIISLLYKASHKDVKLLLIDPKMVELASYNGIPHLLSPVITDIKAATAALKWAVTEMEKRYEALAQHGVRSIHRYNEKAKTLGLEKMPEIVIIIDELSDLMMMAPQDVEDSIIRIAQKARACGMHLLIATQRPSVDVITGLIKANIPTRIAFSVSSQVDSRTIIDQSGAERLLGKGDMLFSKNGSGNLIRLQGPFVSDEEIEQITEYLRTVAKPNYLFEQEQLLKEVAEVEEVDELFEDVVQLILEHEQASTSMLQRHFRIGYNRAARIIDTLERRGMISEQRGSKPRDVLFTIDELDEYL